MESKFLKFTGLLLLIIISIYFFHTKEDIITKDAKENHHKHDEDKKIRSNKNATSSIEIKKSLPEKYLTLNENKDSKEPNISTAVAGLARPLKPVHLHIDDFLSKTSQTRSEKLSLLADLSFCANRRAVSKIISHEKGKNPSEAMELDAALKEYTDYCSSVHDRGYLLRSEILRTLAQNGDVDAKALFFHAGPIGRWPDENEYLPMPEEDVENWVNTSISYLIESAESGNIGAYQTLGSIYSSHESPIMSRVSDPVEAYAYNYLWATLTSANSTSSARDALTRYIEEIERNITTEQRERGRARAQEIFINRKK